MLCPEVVRELVKAYVWHSITESAVGGLLIHLDDDEKAALEVKGVAQLYPSIAAVFNTQTINWDIPSATVIDGFSLRPPKELEIASQEVTNCVYCLDTIDSTPNALIGTLPCRHRFHMLCLEKRLCDANKCSICRTVIQQGIHQADIDDTQARQAVRSLLRATKADIAEKFAEAALARMMHRGKHDEDTLSLRNFAMGLVALADCKLRTGKFKDVLRVSNDALQICPDLGRLQRAEIFRLQANAIAADGGTSKDADGLLRYKPEVEALFRKAYRLDPVPYQGQIGNDYTKVAVWSECLVNPQARQHFEASVEDHLRGRSLRLHTL